MRALVTGGGGFLGKAIVRKLLVCGEDIRSFSRGYYKELNALGVEHIQGDLADYEAVCKAVKGCDIVFHVGAKAGIWGKYKDFYHANVTGTENVINACRKENVFSLVFTSSPSVIFDKYDVNGGNETIPYPKKYLANYPRTKALAEQKVIAANGPDLATVSLRPHLIWGPGDNHLIPAIISQARSGRLRMVGNGNNLVDTVYIDNAAQAHIQAARALMSGLPVAGNPYFITQGKPIKAIDMINHILDAADLPPVNSFINPTLAYCAGAFLETLYGIIPLPGMPFVTRFLALELSRNHWFSIEAARRDFGYCPQVTMKEGLSRLREHFSISG